MCDLAYAQGLGCFFYRVCHGLPDFFFLLFRFCSYVVLVSDADAVEWFDIRDMVLIMNLAKLDPYRAMRKAAACPHPNAVWLTSIFEGSA